jgi:hypothetical protein
MISDAHPGTSGTSNEKYDTLFLADRTIAFAKVRWTAKRQYWQTFAPGSFHP